MMSSEHDAVLFLQERWVHIRYDIILQLDRCSSHPQEDRPIVISSLKKFLYSGIDAYVDTRTCSHLGHLTEHARSWTSVYWFIFYQSIAHATPSRIRLHHRRRLARGIGLCQNPRRTQKLILLSYVHNVPGECLGPAPSRELLHLSCTNIASDSSAARSRQTFPSSPYVLISGDLPTVPELTSTGSSLSAICETSLLWASRARLDGAATLGPRWHRCLRDRLPVACLTNPLVRFAYVPPQAWTARM